MTSAATRAGRDDGGVSKTDQKKEVQPKHLRKIFELPRETDPISSLEISPGNELIAYSLDRLKRSRANRLLHVFSDIDKLFQAESSLKIWNRQTGQVQATISDETVAGFATLRFTPDNKTLVTRDGFSVGVVKIWNAETGALLSNLNGPSKEIRASDLSPNGKFFAAAYADGTARLWAVPSGKLIATLGSPPEKKGSAFKRWINGETDDPFYWISRLYFSPDSSLLAIPSRDKPTGVGNDVTEKFKVWDTATGEARFTIAGSDSFSWGWDSPDLFSPDGSTIATTYTERNGAGNLTANSVKFWSSKDGSLLRTLDHARAPIKFSPDGKRLATGLVHWDDDGTWDFIAEIWNVETGQLQTRLMDPKGSLDEIHWSPDGHTLATTGGGKYTLTIWDAESGQQRAKIRLVRRHCFDPISECISDLDIVFFSPEGQYLIAANQKSFRIIEVKTGSVLEEITGIGVPIAFLSKGELVTLSTDKKNVVLWEIKRD